MELSQKHLTSYKKEGIAFFQRIIAIHETLVYDFKPELKSKSEVWKVKNSQRQQKFRGQATKVKQMVIMAYDYTSVITLYIVSYGHKVDKQVYVNFLCKILRLKVRQLRSQMLDCVISFPITTLVHILQRLLPQFFRNMVGKVVYHPLYNPDLILPDYNLFPKLKELLWRIRFSNK